MYEKAIFYCKTNAKISIEAEKTILNEMVEKLKLEKLELNNVLYYLNNEEIETINNWVFDYSKLILVGNNVRRYKNLNILLSIIGGFICNVYEVYNNCSLDESLAMLCKSKFQSLLIKRKDFFTNEKNGKIEKYIQMPFEKEFLFFSIKYFARSGEYFDIFLCDRENDGCVSFENCPIGEQFLELLLQQLRKENFASVVSFAEFILKYYKIEITYDFKEFKELYEKTNEEIMILDQRYYAEKNLEMQEESLLQERANLRQRQREAEREEEYRRQQLEAMEIANREAERRHQESLRQAEKNRQAQYESQIATLKGELDAERWSGRDDYRKINSLQNQINELKSKSRK